MRLSLAYNRCLCLVIALGITSFASAASTEGGATPLLIAFALPVAVGAWWLSVRRRMLLPRSVVNLLLLAVLAYAAIQTLARRSTVEGVAELVVFIQLIKLGDRRTPRDDAQILSLGVFLAIAAMLTSNGLWVGIQLLIFVPLLIATVMLFQLHTGLLQASGAQRQPGPAGPEEAGAPGALGQLRGAVGFSTVGIALMAAMVFLIMPRGIGENALGTWKRQVNTQATGFTDRVVLGTRSIISESPRIVLDLTVQEASGDQTQPGPSLGSSAAVFYLRGAVLDQYSGGAWVPGEPETRVGRISRQDVAGEQELPISAGSTATIAQTISLREAGSRPTPLFAVWRPVTFRFAAGMPRQQIEIDHTNRTARRIGPPGPFTYTVLSAASETLPGEDPQRTPTSFDSPRIHDLAATVLREAGIDPDPAARPIADDFRAAHLIQSHLQRSYKYTLEEPGAAPGADPIEDFLFTSKRGHCEYFAAAMVAMCRSVGINARMIAGYVAAEYDESTAHYTVRESNAHAWVEAEAGENRWRRFDPTPPEELSRLHAGKPGLIARLRRALDSIEYAWNTSVIGFDQSAQQKILGPIQGDERDGFLGKIDTLAQRLRNVGIRAFLISMALGVAVFAGVAAGGLGLRALLPRLGLLAPRFKRRGAGGALPSSQARFYTQLLAILRRRGLAKPDWRPPLDHAAAIDASDLALGDATRQLAALYYRARFGGRPLSADELGSARRLLRGLARRVRQDR